MAEAPRARHGFEDHTGELTLRVDAASLPDLFAEAGRALATFHRLRVRETPDGFSTSIVLDV